MRFGTPFIGSRALVGRLDDELLNRKDQDGVCVRHAIQDFGLDPREIPEAALKGDTIGYVEFHIEQGPVLDALERPLGVVEAIAGQSRLEFIFTGSANHAGTTPMNQRRDAIAAAAEWITAVEREAQRVEGLVATVGSFTAKPGAPNVIAGETRLTLDVRHGSNEIRNSAVETLVRLRERDCGAARIVGAAQRTFDAAVRGHGSAAHVSNRRSRSPRGLRASRDGQRRRP